MEWNLKNIRTLIIKYFNEKAVILNITKIENGTFNLTSNAHHNYKFMQTEKNIAIDETTYTKLHSYFCSNNFELSKIIQAIENDFHRIKIQNKLTTLAMEIE